ncbi:hypothetical protein [Neorhodopirellula lusitana]|uniref:hypothetical protein n=1 Tax=Neorhodopirellula lusitana TaxID=445327 RepID=UPI0024B821E2|nr:hypothetical protein [Neorhodopirellula lusitana]
MRRPHLETAFEHGKQTQHRFREIILNSLPVPTQRTDQRVDSVAYEATEGFLAPEQSTPSV